MHYLNPIYVMLHMPGHKTLIQSKASVVTEKIHEDVFFMDEIPTCTLYLKTPKF